MQKYRQEMRRGHHSPKIWSDEARASRCMVSRSEAEPRYEEIMSDAAAKWHLAISKMREAYYAMLLDIP